MRLTIKYAVLIMMLSLFFCPQIMAGITDDLLAHYRFDNSANDETDFENHGSLFPENSDDYTKDRFGRDVFAYKFSSGEHISIINADPSFQPANNDLGAGITISAWIRLDATTGTDDKFIFTNDHTTNYGFFMKISGGKLVFGNDDGEPNTPPNTPRIIESDGTINPNEWYHVVGVLRAEGTTPLMALYIDGTIDNETLSGSDGVAYETIKSGYIGKDFIGDIDDVRFYKAAKSSSEITKLYNGEILINLPESVTENDEVLKDIGKITIYKAAGTSGLTFTLRSSDEKKIKVGNVTIPSGQKEATFDLTLVDNDEADEDKEVTITVRRSSFIESSAKINVKDDETMGCFITTLLN